MTLLVLGASSDMGVALIERIGDKYDCIIAHYYHMNDRLQNLKKIYKEKMVLLQADLSVLEETNQLIEDVSEIESIPCHIVHFPAQQIQLRKFIKTEWDVFETDISISIRSLVLLLQTLIPKMTKNRYGRIVIMLSDSVVGSPPKYSSDYVMTKYALLGLVKSLAIEFADKGITINGISPAFTETKFITGMADLIMEEHKSRSPIGRNLTPQDIVPTIEMLMSEEASCINGQNISINCGR